MAIGQDTADEISENTIRILKLLGSLRHLVPRVHPELDPSSYPSLFALSAGPQRVSDLAGCVHSDVSTASRQVSALVSLGLAQKVPDPHDRRVQLVGLTPDGTTVIERLQDSRRIWFQAMLATWSEADGADFASYLTRFVADLETFRADALGRPEHAHRTPAGWISQTATT
ncbi:MAG TPA: MarR family transcriptional regulator [Candidatus Lustribacter sp.]|nr:MarR family transcriptional regulator [Candidatus Lustribacter sp.]